MITRKIKQIFSTGHWFRASAILLIYGATVGTLLDGAHTHSHSIEYAKPVFWMAAWWTPLVFAMGSFTTGISRPFLERFLEIKAPQQSWLQVLGAAVLFYTAYVMSGYLPIDNQSRTIILAVIWLLLWFTFDRKSLGLFLSVITALWGPCLEMGLSYLGLFWYVEPDLFTVTSWLPVLYAIAAVANGNFGRKLVS